MRKAVGKKIKALLDEQREKFCSQAALKPTITRERAEEVWNFIEPFARYGFNRAHAACYAMIAYQTAYLKAHYPVEFMASLLTSDANNLDRIGIEIAECREMGVQVLPPDVNESFVEFGAIFYSAEDKAERRHDSYVRFGLGAIKNVGVQPAEAIVAERQRGGPFRDLADFLRRCANASNRKVLENLAMAGALDCLAERQQILHNMDGILLFTSSVAKGNRSTQFSLFTEEESPEMYHLHLSPCPPAEQKLCLSWERELLGIYLSSHPIASYRDQLPPDRELIGNLSHREANEVLRVAGIVMSMRTILTKTNQRMAFVQLEDETGPVEVVVFPRTWTESEKKLVEGEAVIIEAKVSRDLRRGGQRRKNEDGEEIEEDVSETKLLADKIFSIADVTPVQEDGATTQKRRTAQAVMIRIPEDGDRALLQTIKGHLEKSPGGLPVSLGVPTVDGEQELQITHRIELSEQLYSQLAYLVGTERVVLR